MSNNSAYAVPQVKKTSASTCMHIPASLNRRRFLQIAQSNHPLPPGSIQDGLPLRRRPLLRPHLLHPPPTRRSSQDSCPTIRDSQCVASHSQNHPLLTKSGSWTMAWDTPLCSSYGLRFCPLLHKFERAAPDDRAGQSSTRPRKHIIHQQIFLRPSKALQYGQLGHRRRRSRRRRLRHDARHRPQGAL